jgi:uncharacterized protein YdcH (DUF465 family)
MASNPTFTTDRLILRQAIATTKQEIANLKEKIASYQVLPETNRLDSLCALFGDDEAMADDCKQVAEIKSRRNTLLLDGLTTNHPSFIRLQVKHESLETKIEGERQKEVIEPASDTCIP